MPASASIGARRFGCVRLCGLFVITVWAEVFGGQALQCHSAFAPWHRDTFNSSTNFQPRWPVIAIESPRRLTFCPLLLYYNSIQFQPVCHFSTEGRGGGGGPVIRDALSPPCLSLRGRQQLPGNYNLAFCKGWGQPFALSVQLWFLHFILFFFNLSSYLAVFFQAQAKMSPTPQMNPYLWDVSHIPVWSLQEKPVSCQLSLNDSEGRFSRWTCKLSD